MGKAGLKLALAAGMGLWLTACAAEAPPPAPPAPPPPQIAVAPPSPPPAPRPPPPAPDQCGARDLQYLVGHSKTEIPIPLQPGMRRVVCTTCPMSQDFVPGRQTVMFDPATGMVTAIKCG
jgi:hypothetical protein